MHLEPEDSQTLVFNNVRSLQDVSIVGFGWGSFHSCCWFFSVGISSVPESMVTRELETQFGGPCSEILVLGNPCLWIPGSSWPTLPTRCGRAFSAYHVCVNYSWCMLTWMVYTGREFYLKADKVFLKFAHNDCEFGYWKWCPNLVACVVSLLALWLMGFFRQNTGGLPLPSFQGYWPRGQIHLLHWRLPTTSNWKPLIHNAISCLDGFL